MKTTQLTIPELLKLEWLETNGLGGYASSSLTGANTRKYHGLLVAPQNPPTARNILVAKIEERIKQGDTIDDIAVNIYPNTVYPEGHRYLQRFERRPIATWYYQGAAWQLTKKIWMVPNSNTTVVKYTNIGARAFELEMHPLLVHKDYHATARQNHFDYYYEREGTTLKVHAYPNCPPLYMNWSEGEFIEHRAWYKDVQLPEEVYRGQESVEDYYRIGYTAVILAPGTSVTIRFTTDEVVLHEDSTALEDRVMAHILGVRDPKVTHEFYNDLLLAGNQFIVDRAATASKTIIAGYHWFTDWGRDTMIAMRGLTIATGDQQTSVSILHTFFKYLDQGMLPNRFPDYEGQEVEYNTIDATLWLFVALYEYVQKFEDIQLIQQYFDPIEAILLHHIQGTRYNIHLTAEGLISGGEKGWQLTWMDAKVAGHVVTPRIGSPVEINALWYNALCVYTSFCDALQRPAKSIILDAKTRITTHFRDVFMSPEGYLYDVIHPDQSKDSSFRPNQIMAVSLPFTLLTASEAATVVNQVAIKLKTEYGLRTLDQENSDFVGQYAGNQWARDTAYHQGTVWPFLMMEYWEAYLKVNDYTTAAKEQVLMEMEPLQSHFYTSDCIHGISEIFDGVAPKQGRGCIQQAWSVAALLKIYASHALYAVKTQPMDTADAYVS